MGIVCEKSRPDETGVNKTFIVSLFDIVEQFFGVKIGAIRNERIPDVRRLPHQLGAEQSREVAHDLIATLLSSGDQGHKTAQSRAPDPFVRVLILD